MPEVKSSVFDMVMVPVVIKMPSLRIPVDCGIVFDIWMLPSLVMVPPKKELKIPIPSIEFDKIMFPVFRLVNSPWLLKLRPPTAVVVNVPPLVKLARLSNPPDMIEMSPVLLNVPSFKILFLKSCPFKVMLPEFMSVPKLSIPPNVIAMFPVLVSEPPDVISITLGAVMVPELVMGEVIVTLQNEITLSSEELGTVPKSQLSGLFQSSQFTIVKVSAKEEGMVLTSIIPKITVSTNLPIISPIPIRITTYF